MKKQRIICALLLAASTALAAPEPRITFSGDSTLHGFSGRGRASSFEHRRQPDGAHVFAVTVTAQSLDTDNDARDKKMLKLLDAAHFPKLAGRLDPIPDAWLAGADGAAPLACPLQLTLRDREGTVPATVQRISDGDGHPQLAVSFTVSLEAFGLAPPSVLGLIRVRDTVEVRVELPLNESETTDS